MAGLTINYLNGLPKNLFISKFAKAYSLKSPVNLVKEYESDVNYRLSVELVEVMVEDNVQDDGTIQDNEQLYYSFSFNYRVKLEDAQDGRLIDDKMFSTDSYDFVGSFPATIEDFESISKLQLEDLLKKIPPMKELTGNNYNKLTTIVDVDMNLVWPDNVDKLVADGKESAFFSIDKFELINGELLKKLVGNNQTNELYQFRVEVEKGELSDFNGNKFKKFKISGSQASLSDSLLNYKVFRCEEGKEFEKETFKIYYTEYGTIKKETLILEEEVEFSCVKDIIGRLADKSGRPLKDIAIELVNINDPNDTFWSLTNNGGKFGSFNMKSNSFYDLKINNKLISTIDLINSPKNIIDIGTISLQQNYKLRLTHIIESSGDHVATLNAVLNNVDLSSFIHTTKGARESLLVYNNPGAPDPILGKSHATNRPDQLLKIPYINNSPLKFGFVHMTDSYSKFDKVDLKIGSNPLEHRVSKNDINFEIFGAYKSTVSPGMGTYRPFTAQLRYYVSLEMNFSMAGGMFSAPVQPRFISAGDFLDLIGGEIIDDEDDDDADIDVTKGMWIPSSIMFASVPQPDGTLNSGLSHISKATLNKIWLRKNFTHKTEKTIGDLFQAITLKGTIKKVATCGQTHSSSICAEAQQLTPDSCSITQYKWCTKNDDFTPLGGTNDDDLITDTNDDVIGGDDSDGSGNPPSDW